MQSPRSSHVIPLLCLGGAVLFWGTSFAATKSALQSFSPMAVIWLRMLVATFVIAFFVPKMPRPRMLPGDWKLLALNAVFMPCAYYALEAYAVTFTTSSQAGVISALVPLLVAGGAWVFLRERLGARTAIAIAVSIVGMGVLSLTGTSQASAPNPALGNLLEFTAMVCAAGSTLVVKHLAERYHPWLITAFQAAVGAVFFAPFAIASGVDAWLSAPLSAWAGVIYLGIAVSLGAFGLYNTALTMLPASRAALAINLVPAVAMITGWLALGETLSIPQMVACVVIVGAVIFGETGGEREPAEPITEKPAEDQPGNALPETEPEVA